MITTYENIHYDYLKNHISEFNIDFLNSHNPFNNTYLYLLANKPVGLISFSTIYDRVELDYIWVHKEYRKKGIASKMLNYMLNNTDVNSISLEVAIDNTSAINLYKKYGFKVATIRKKYYNGKDAYLMIREMM